MKIKVASRKEKKEKKETPLKDFRPLEGFNLETATKILIFSLLFLLPLFFGFGKINNLAFNKQLLLVFLTFLILSFWFLISLSKGKFTVQLSFLHLVSLFFLLAFLISTAFSLWKWGSFWGWPLDGRESFLTLFCFFVFYLSFSHLIKEKEVLSSQLLLVISGSLAALIGILHVFGKFIFPWLSTKTISFNTIGTVNSWAIFLGALLPAVLALIFASRGLMTFILSILGILIFSGLVVVNYQTAWIEVLVGMSAFLIFGLWKSRRSSYKFLFLPAIIFSFALIFGVIRFQIPGLPSTTLEVMPSFRATAETVFEMVKSSPKSWFLGWGPGTFKYGWSKFRDVSLNRTIFWNIRFSRGNAQLMEMIGTVGPATLAVYCFFTLFALFKGVKAISALAKEDESVRWFLLLGSFCGFLALTTTKFLYPGNLSLSFLWWFFLANMAIFSPKKVKIFELTADSKANFVFSFVGILILVGGVFLFYLQGTRYLAETKYVQALTANDFEKTKNLFLGAVRLNPQQELFWQDLSQIYLLKANQEILRTDISTEEKTQQASNFIANAVAAAKRATEINPSNVANWQVRGSVYRGIIGWSKGAFEWSVRSYERALSLEPSNPFILVELGRTYMVQSSIADSEEEKSSYLERAEDYFRQAIGLKPDYAQAFYQMSLLYESKGERKEAISTLESIKAMAPFMVDYNPLQDVGLAFQLGLLYYQDENFEKARTEFERAIALNPNYANAKYFLGIAYDKLGNKDKAIRQFEEIEKFNPDNQEVRKILSNLEAGRPALEEIEEVPESVPVEETPEEK